MSKNMLLVAETMALPLIITSCFSSIFRNTYQTEVIMIQGRKEPTQNGKNMIHSVTGAKTSITCSKCTTNKHPGSVERCTVCIKSSETSVTMEEKINHLDITSCNSSISHGINNNHNHRAEPTISINDANVTHQNGRVAVNGESTNRTGSSASSKLLVSSTHLSSFYNSSLGNFFSVFKDILEFFILLTHHMTFNLLTCCRFQREVWLDSHGLWTLLTSIQEVTVVYRALKKHYRMIKFSFVKGLLIHNSINTYSKMRLERFVLL